jgi:two-component system, cell cycle sensor histidine kinase and response regulator CckA
LVLRWNLVSIESASGEQNMNGQGQSELSVLLVEDDPGAARFIDEMLTHEGPLPVAVTHVSRLHEALVYLRTRRFSAILLDLTLPDSKGLDTLARACAEAPEIPIVVLTGLDHEKTAADAVRDGARDYLVKGRVDGPLLYKSIQFAVERQAAEQALRRSESRYRALIERSIQGIVIHVDGVIRFANPAMAKLFGFDRAADAIGSNIFSFIAPADRQKVMEHARARRVGLHAPDHYELRALKRDGSVVWLDALVTAVPWDDQPATLAAVIDVTEAKRAEEDLRGSEERFRQLVENIKEAFILTELPGHETLYLSRAWEEICGRSLEDLYGDSRVWFDAVHPDDREAVEAAIREVEGGKPATTTFRVGRPDGSIRWVRARAFPVLSAERRAYRLVGLVEDITDVRRTEDQLLQAQKMEAVGRLAGGVAHDFNNLLTAILGYAELVAADLGTAHPSRADIQEIITAADSAENLTRQLLAFSRRQVLQPQILDLNQVLKRMERLLRRLIREDIELRMSLAPHLGLMNADSGQIEQVVMNLAANARDAMPDGGRLIIETTNVVLDADSAQQHSGAVPGVYVVLTVSDTGVGMDRETQTRLFEPFFTTKELGQGTGLGLATVYGIVKQSQGSISVYSEPGHGSTFKIYFPIVGAETVAALPERREAPSLTGDETVLIVEDQAQTRAVTCKILRRHGYSVIEAATGPEAIVKSAEYQGRIDVLLTDVVLPAMNGRRVADLLQSARTSLRVIYMSGYTTDAIVHHGMLDPGLVLIQKPYTAEALLRQIREVLDSPEQ